MAGIKLNQSINVSLQSNPSKEVTMSSTTASQIFSQLAQLAASEAFPPVLTLVNSTLADIEANPQEWVNPASAMVKGTAFVANLVASLPAIENAAVPAAAQLISATLAAISAKLASPAAVTPTSVGTAIGDAITGTPVPTPAPVAGSIAAS